MGCVGRWLRLSEIPLLPVVRVFEIFPTFRRQTFPHITSYDILKGRHRPRSTWCTEAVARQQQSLDYDEDPLIVLLSPEQEDPRMRDRSLYTPLLCQRSASALSIISSDLGRHTHDRRFGTEMYTIPCRKLAAVQHFDFGRESAHQEETPTATTAIFTTEPCISPVACSEL